MIQNGSLKLIRSDYGTIILKNGLEIEGLTWFVYSKMARIGQFNPSVIILIIH